MKDKDLEIKQLGERCNQLLKDKGDLTDKVTRLEQQIEKMKFWHNKTEMEVVRDVLTEYINNHESFDVAIFNVRNRLNGR